MLKHSRLLEVLDYNKTSGQFTWKAATRYSSPKQPGDIAGTKLRGGYIGISIDGKKYLAHRLAWFYEHGEMPSLFIDHINGKTDDNRISNLRVVTNQQNAQNKRTAHANNSHGFLGVSKEGGKWKARIRVDGKEKYLGLFATPDEAHAAYVAAKVAFHPFQTLKEAA